MSKTQEVDYQALFNVLPGALMLVAADAPNFTIVAENQAHADVALRPLNEVIGMKFLEAYPDTSAKFKRTGVSDVVESLQRVVATGKPDEMKSLRYDLKMPDGSLERRYWQATHYPLFDDQGKVWRILQSTANKTEEVLTSRKLDETRRQLDEALAIGLIGTWLWDLKDDYIVADKNLLRLFGIEPSTAAEGLPLKQFTDSIHADDRQRVTESIQSAVAEKGTFEQEYRTITTSGDVRWVIARGRVETDDDGKPERFPGVIVDISERKQAELSLRFLSGVSTVLASSLDYDQTLRSIAELAVPELADWCSIDLLEDGVIRQVALEHKDPAKVEWARRLREVRPPSLDEPHGVPAVLRSGKPEFIPVINEEKLPDLTDSQDELELARSLQLSSAIIVPLKVRGKVTGAVTLVYSESRRHYTQEDLDIALELANRASLAMANSMLYQTAQDEIEARAVLEEQLREANERLEARVKERTLQLTASNRELQRSNQELQDFAYVASHDLQEPLRKIQAFGNLLEDEYASQLGDGRDYLLRMRKAASRMSVLIEDLLAFSRITTKAKPLTEVDLNQIAREVVEDLEVRIKDTGAEVEVSDLPVIYADRLQMRQLLQNLIGNALKFRQAEVSPVVKIRAESGDADSGSKAMCRVYVVDNGIGFDEKYLDRIFSVFQRLHGKDIYQGTGIGLAICRKIAERHGGSITASSTVGQGATFVVTLPVNDH